MPATLEKLDNLGYVIKVKDKNLYVIADHLPVDRLEAWGNELAEIKVYKTIEEAQEIKRAFDKCKHNYNNIRDFNIQVQLVHKKPYMIAKLKGSKNED